MRRPRLLPLLGALSLALPVLEILVIIQVARGIGVGLTFLLLVAGVIGGTWLIRREGQRSLRVMMTGWRQGAPPAEGLARSGWVVLAGVLLAIPGFITDVLAALVMIPVTRAILGRLVRRVGPRNTTWVQPTAGGDQTEPTVVRGDVI